MPITSCHHPSTTHAYIDPTCNNNNNMQMPATTEIFQKETRLNKARPKSSVCTFLFDGKKLATATRLLRCMPLAGKMTMALSIPQFVQQGCNTRCKEQGARSPNKRVEGRRERGVIDCTVDCETVPPQNNIFLVFIFLLRRGRGRHVVLPTGPPLQYSLLMIARWWLPAYGTTSGVEWSACNNVHGVAWRGCGGVR